MDASLLLDLLDHIADAVIVLGMDQRIRFINSSAGLLFGYEASEMIGQPLDRLLPERFRDTHPHDIEDFARGGENIRKMGHRPIVTGQRRDGSEFPAEVTITKLHQQGDAFLVAIVRDASDRRRSEERYRALYESSIDGILLTEPGGDILAANPAACQIFGYSEDELRQLGRSGVVDLSDPRATTFLEERSRTGRARSELRLIRKGGVIFPADVTSGVFEDREGRLRTSMIVRDISGYKKIEEALRASETRFRLLFENIPLPVLIYDAESQSLLDVNDAACRQYGYERHEMLAMSILDIHHPEDLPAMKEFLASGEADQEVVIGGRHRKKDGSVFDAEINSYILSLEGQLYRILVVRDVTERILVERQLHESAEHARLVMSATTDAIWDWDLVTNQVQWNHGLRTLFGYPADSIREHKWWMDHVHPDDIRPTEESVQAAIASGEKFWTGEYRYRRADNTFAHVVDRGYVIHDKNGKPVRMVGAMVDITDRVMLAEAQTRAKIEERQRLARDLHDSVSQMLYSVTLLAEAARRFSQAGDHQLVAHYLNRLGETAQQSLKEMRLLVYELRPQLLEEKGLAGALRNRLEMVEKRAGIDATLITAGELHLPQQVEEELYHIAQEALNNSLKHSASPSVSVRLSSDGEYVELEVSDSGNGFTNQDTSERGGLGFSSMRERADRLGAELDIQSGLGQGATVRVRAKIDPAATPTSIKGRKNYG